MIFIGDVALPPRVTPNVGQWDAVFKGSFAVANLEGALATNGSVSSGKYKLFNQPAVLEYLAGLSTKVVTLANNHILDAGVMPSETIRLLQSKNILACGAGDDEARASEPVVLTESGKKRLFLGFGWEPIQCRAAAHQRPGINPLRPKHVLESVVRARRSDPDATIILLMHWNYELELYPQPMHRQLAFAAIDAGANAVVGSHCHCVQGIEVFRDAPIVYCLGNWFVPQGDFFGGRLFYPAIASRQLAFQWEPELNKITCHWFDYHPDTHAITYLESEDLNQSELIKERTPFAGMNHAEYIRWFRRNRVRRRGLPVYKSCDDLFQNWMKDKYVQLRQTFIDLLLRVELKKGPSFSVKEA